MGVFVASASSTLQANKCIERISVKKSFRPMLVEGDHLVALSLYLAQLRGAMGTTCGFNGY